MSMRLSVENLRELALVPQSSGNSGALRAGKRRIIMPSTTGKGTLDFENPGRELLTVHGRFDLQTKLDIDFTEEVDIGTPSESFVEVGVLLGGAVDVPWASTRTHDVSLRAGQIGIWRHGHEEIHRISHSEAGSIEYFAICAGKQVFKDFFAEDEVDEAVRNFERTVNGDRRIHLVQNTDINVMSAIRQYLTMPFAGGLGKMFAEGKAKEILSLLIAEVSLQTGGGTASGSRLSKSDIDKIHSAERYLLDNMENPPTLAELARCVGTNEQKLKTGFKEVFGATVFNYLRNQRLDLAKRMLQSGSESVSEVALTVGYSHLGHFSANFKERFGVLPSHYRKWSGRTVHAVPKTLDS